MSNRVSAPPHSGAMPTVSAPSLRKIPRSGCMHQRCGTSGRPTRPDRRYGEFKLLQGEIDVLHRMRGGYRTLLGGNGHEEHTTLNQRAAQLYIPLEVVGLENVMEVSRSLRHQVIAERRPLADDRGRYTVRGKDVAQAVLHP